MSLFIRDPEVNALAEELRRVTKAKSKTDAVRAALRAQLTVVQREIPLLERIAVAQAMADALGKKDRNFDMKAFTDDMWGG